MPLPDLGQIQFKINLQFDMMWSIVSHWVGSISDHYNWPLGRSTIQVHMSFKFKAVTIAYMIYPQLMPKQHHLSLSNGLPDSIWKECEISLKGLFTPSKSGSESEKRSKNKQEQIGHHRKISKKIFAFAQCDWALMNSISYEMETLFSDLKKKEWLSLLFCQPLV